MTLWRKRSANPQAEARLKAIFHAHEKRESRQSSFKKLFGGGSKSASESPKKTSVQDIPETIIENEEQVDETCQQQWLLPDPPSTLRLVTLSSPNWLISDATTPGSSTSSSTIDLVNAAANPIPEMTHLVFSLASSNSSTANTTEAMDGYYHSTQQNTLSSSVYSNSRHTSNHTDYNLQSNCRQTLSRLQEITSSTTMQCIKAKEIIQWYDAQEILFNLSKYDVKELHKIFWQIYQPICDLHAIVKEIDTELSDGLADSKAEWTLAQADIFLAQTPLNNIPSSVHGNPMDRVASLSGLGYVIDRLMKLLHRIPLKVILPEIDAPESPLVSRPSDPWMNENTLVRHRHAMVMSADGNNFHQTVFKTCQTLRNDRLDIISPQISGAICADIFHFTILMEGSNEIHSNFVRWTAASAPGAVADGKMTVKHIRKHISEKLNLPPYFFEFWSGDNKLQSDGDETILLSWTHNMITIILDPVIEVVVNGAGSISIDFSEDPVNKAFIPIGQIKEKIRRMLGAEDDKPLSLYLVKEELTNDSITLWETGMLSIQQAEGFSFIRLKADYNRPKRTCMTCMEDKHTSRFHVKVTSNCSHDINICKPCLRHWIDERLNTNGTNIPCPECNEAMGYEDVKRCAKKSQFER
jgi:hypothetical protein